MILECTTCEALVHAVVVATYDAYDDETHEAGRYTFAKCPKCSTPMVAWQWNFGDGLELAQRLFPQVDPVNLHYPRPIREAFEEARRCFKAKAFTASAIMCRKILEGVCHHHGLKNGTLSTNLKKLRDTDVIETRLYEWADTLRISGNEAAHGVDVTVSAEDAKDILDFTEALLEYVITYRQRFDAFTKRRSSRKESAPGG